MLLRKENTSLISRKYMRGNRFRESKRLAVIVRFKVTENELRCFSLDPFKGFDVFEEMGMPDWGAEG